MLVTCAAISAPGLAADAALIELGRRWIDGYVETFMGKSTTMIARLLGPKKMADNRRAVNDFYVATSTALGDKHVQVDLNVGGVVRSPARAGPRPRAHFIKRGEREGVSALVSRGDGYARNAAAKMPGKPNQPG